jgi:alcohol dehydrogenase (cytochrome c)
MATAYNPATGLFYVMTIENCGVYRSTQFGPAAQAANAAARGGGGRGGGGRGGGGDTGTDPPKRYLRALDIHTGKVVWEVDQKVPSPNYGGVLSTSGGVLFYSESTGAFAAVDAQTGSSLWHFETGQPPKASPMTYMFNGRQFVAIASGASILSFALPENP